MKETLEEVAKEFFRKFKHTHSPDNYFLALVEFAKWQQERSYSEEEVTILRQNIINEIEIRKQNIISKSETMSVHLLEGGCMAFESSQDVVKAQFNKFKNK
jgi:hypothetical protein